MELFEQSVVAFFAAVGIAWAAWSIAEALFLSKREKLERGLVLIPAARDASALERTVARLSWASAGGAPFERILIADCGLDERGRALARQLEQQYAAVRLCTMEDAEAYVRNR